MKTGNELSIAKALADHYHTLDQEDNRPNILILMTDQQRYDTIAALGYDYMYTPNLDRLVNEGCSYVNAYTPNPICCPARHSFITGVSTAEHGIADNDFNARLSPSQITFPRLFSQAGYITEAIGKMHFQPCREHHGYQRLKLMEEVPEDRYDDDYLVYLKENGFGNVQNIHGVRNILFYSPQQAIIPEEHHGTSWVTDRGIEFLEENAGTRPFLLYLSYIAPHPPFNSYRKYSDLYKDADIPDPYVSQTPLCSMSEENMMFGDLPGEDYVRRMREVYLGMISQIDYNIGRILMKLEEKNQLDNTVIVFTSDHGDLLGDYGLYQKFLPYDSSSRIPMIIRYPAEFSAGNRITEFADLTDVFPTLLDIAGIDYSFMEGLVGESLIRDKPVKDRSVQYVSYSEGNRRWASIRDSRYKYTYYYGGGHRELFDLAEDPHETVNLLADGILPENIDISSKMHGWLIEYERSQWKPEYIEDGDLMRMDQYKPVSTRNKAFPRFLRKLPDSDQEVMNDFIDEVIKAVESEEIVDFNDLDYESFRKNSGYSQDEINRLLKQKKKR